VVPRNCPFGTANLNITSNIPVICTNALRGKTIFKRPADDARQGSIKALPYEGTDLGGVPHFLYERRSERGYG
jgi:hypothetical protein